MRVSFQSLGGPLIAVMIGAICLWLSWETWPDALIDFGREAYTPWRLSEGQALYRDIEHFNGPLSQYLHAALFQVAGVGLNRLYWFNIGNVVLTSVLLYRVLQKFSGAFGATCGLIAFLTLFAFAHLISLGNFNYICPYSYELTHGMTFALAAVLCHINWLNSGRRVWLASAALLLGLSFLTKPEVFAAATVAGVVGFVVRLGQHRVRNYRQLGAEIGVFVSCSLLPIMIAFLLLATQMPAWIALRGMAGSWKYLGDERLMSLQYFAKLKGTDDVGASVVSIVNWSAGYAATLGVGIWLSRRASRQAPAAQVISGIVAGVAALVALYLLTEWLRPDWPKACRAVPIALLCTCCALLWRDWRRRVVLTAGQIAAVLFAAFSLALAWRMALALQFPHYGFALAMPASVFIVAAATGTVPAWLSSKGHSPLPMRMVAIACIGFVVAILMNVNLSNWRQKNQNIGTAPDRFRAAGVAQVVEPFLEEIRQRFTADESLVCMPEGLLINYLTRRVNPTPHVNFNPASLIMFGEGVMLRDLSAAMPDYVLLIVKEHEEYSLRYFGQDYGREIVAWVRRAYEPIRFAGPPPEAQSPEGIWLLKRRGT